MHQQLVLTGPIEFDWGYPGKEAKNLALALLADALEGGDDPLVDEKLEALHDEVTSRLPAGGWQIHQEKLVAWIFGRLSAVPVEPLPLDLLQGGVTHGLN